MQNFSDNNAKKKHHLVSKMLLPFVVLYVSQVLQKYFYRQQYNIKAPYYMINVLQQNFNRSLKVLTYNNKYKVFTFKLYTINLKYRQIIFLQSLRLF